MSNNKVVAVSLNRTATQSTSAFLEKLGYKTIHWIGQEFENSEINSFDREKLFSLVHDAELKYDAFSDLPFNYMYKYFDKHYDTKFILIKRPVDEWISSIRKLYSLDSIVNNKSEFDIFEKEMFWRHMNSTPKNILECSDQDLEVFYNSYHLEIDRYFENKDNLLTLEMSDPDKGQKICLFLNTEIRNDFENIDYWRRFS